MTKEKKKSLRCIIAAVNAANCIQLDKEIIEKAAMLKDGVCFCAAILHFLSVCLM